MTVEKTVVLNRHTGQVISIKTEIVDEDPTIYEDALVDFFVSLLQKKDEKK